jgi:hypothetical protein
MARPDEFEQASRRADERRASEPTAIGARYDRRRNRIVVSLSNGVEMTFPPSVAEGLEHATPADLGAIEISPSGFGLHFPKLDAHLYLPALLQGVFGSKKWIAAQLGAAGGAVRSAAKTAAARANGQRGGRPRRRVSAR